MPSELIFEVSADGDSYTEAGRLRPGVDMRDLTVQIKDCEIPVQLAARYIRVRALNPGPIPDWHPGSGSPSFIFIDEIWVE